MSANLNLLVFVNAQQPIPLAYQAVIKWASKLKLSELAKNPIRYVFKLVQQSKL